jgi:hypothetical protein
VAPLAGTTVVTVGGWVSSNLRTKVPSWMLENPATAIL